MNPSNLEKFSQATYDAYVRAALTGLLACPDVSAGREALVEMAFEYAETAILMRRKRSRIFKEMYEDPQMSEV